jgi:hypothetical protein
MQKVENRLAEKCRKWITGGGGRKAGCGRQAGGEDWQEVKDRGQKMEDRH